MKIADWHRKQKQMCGDLKLTEPRKWVWSAEYRYLNEHGRGFTLSIGAGNCPFGDIRCDPMPFGDVVCIGEYLPFRSGAFDSVLLFSTLDHVIDDEAVLSEAQHVLSRNGRILIMQTIDDSPVEADPNHLRHYRTEDALRSLIYGAGMEIVDYRCGFELGCKVAFLTCKETK